MSAGADCRIAVRTVDIRKPLQPIDDVNGYGRSRIFIFAGDVPVGSVDIANAHGPISVTRLRDAISGSIAHAVLRQALEQTLEGRTGDASLDVSVAVSVVIPTCNRPDDLRRCLTALTAQQTTRPVQIIVVDNRPSPASLTPAVVGAFPGVLMLEEHRPGLSYARNAGLAVATGDIAIAIDDDVTVPQGWLERLLAPFARPEVTAVTGHVLPLELETAAQCRFEAYGGLGKGFARHEADGTWFRSMRGAVPTWNLGATANAAFRTSIFHDARIGMLDEALGAGMPTGCSEDTYLFYRILKNDHVIVYEPAAFVWHRHRRLDRSLRRQIYSYSKGHVAYHLTTLFRDRDRRALLRLFYSLPRTFVQRAFERLRGRSEYPLDLILTEIVGTLAGPWSLWRARRRVRRFGPGARPRTHHAVSMESRLPQAPAA